MAKVRYDVSNVEDASDFKQAPVGMYIAKIKDFTVGESKTAQQPMGTVVFELVKDSKGKKLKERYSNVWHRIPLDDSNPGWTFRLKEFIKAMGAKLKGEIDTEKIVGTQVQVKLKSGTDLDDNYRPEVDKLYALAEPDDDDADEVDDDDDDDAGEDDETPDYSEMSLKDLKTAVEEYEGDPDEIIEEAEATTSKAKKEALIEWLESDDEDDSDDDDAADDDDDADPEDSDDDDDDADDGEDDEEDGDEEGDDYDDWSLEDLKTELKDRDLKVAGKKSVLIARLRKDDSAEEPF